MALQNSFSLQQSAIDTHQQPKNYSSLDSGLTTSHFWGRSATDKNIVFIDKGVKDYQKLAAGVVSGDKVVLLDPKQNEIAQISRFLATEQGVESIHIVSHGSVGSLQLGNFQLNANNIVNYQDSLKSWSQALAPGADILLYGCNVAATAIGKTFVNQLKAITGANIEASTDLTGNAKEGGNWQLEYKTGNVDAPLAFTDTLKQAYQSVLANTNVASFTDLETAITSSSSGDTITFTSDITETGVLSKINKDLSFIGGGHFLDGDSKYRGFFVDSGTVNFSNLTIKKALAQGGNGGVSGGGGAAGMGGALFINSGTVKLDNVTFDHDSAIGGNGGSTVPGGKGGGGGGGNSGGNGSDGMGGGGGGNGGDGIGGIGGIGGSTVSGGSSGGIGGMGGKGGGGGGGGFGDTPGGGGNGGFGGGGGGGGGGGTSGGMGGMGGFGGGGGGGGFDGGGGSFGGGGSGGGFGGSGGDFGGGGAGLGGAIFIREGTLTLSQTTFSNNSATGGTGGNITAGAGQGKGGAIFAMSLGQDSTVTTAPTIYTVDSSPTFTSNTAPDAAGTSGDMTDVYGTINTITSPKVTSIKRLTPSGAVTNVASVTYQVTFDQAVSGVDTSDFKLMGGSAIASPSITSVTPSTVSNATIYDVIVNTGSGSPTGSSNDTLQLNVTDDDTIKSVASGVSLGGTGLGNGDFTTGDTYTLDKTAPTFSKFTAPNITSSSSTPETFTVQYDDSSSVDFSSLSNSNLLVTGPKGFSQAATFVSANPKTNSTNLIATYSVNAPTPAWKSTDNGAYTITLQPSTVKDISGNAFVSANLGSFNVNIPADPVPPVLVPPDPLPPADPFSPVPVPPVTVPPVPVPSPSKAKTVFNFSDQLQLQVAQGKNLVNLLFDEKFYLTQNSDVATAVTKGNFSSGLDHFLKFGQFEGRDPSVLFSNSLYLAENPDISKAVASGQVKSGFVDFVNSGFKAHRDLRMVSFDESYYMVNNTDVKAAVSKGVFRSGFEHYLKFGQKEGRNPSTIFNEADYLAKNPDVKAAIDQRSLASGFDHFTRFGIFEGRNPNAIFSNSDYLTKNPDVAAAVQNGVFKSGLEHALKFGQFEGRAFNSSSSVFDEAYYLAKNSDVAAAVTKGLFKSGFDHFIKFGQTEKRRPSTNYDETSYLAANPDVNAAVKAGTFKSGFEHFLQLGIVEGRVGIS